MKTLLSIAALLYCAITLAQAPESFVDKDTNLYGFKDKSGKIIAPAKFKAVDRKSVV